MGVLRRTTDKHWVTELWAAARTDAQTGACPSCRRPMVASSAGGVDLELCKGCQMVWFDAGEADRAPSLPQRGARTLPQEALERIAHHQAAAIAAEYNHRYGKQMTVDEALPLVPGLVGLPLEDEQRGLQRYPFATWTIAAILVVIGLWSLVSPEAASRYGLLATNIDRLGGATFITALFVHASFFQLATNAYFLMFFGDNVEDYLGSGTFLLLLLTGDLAGNALHAMLASGNTSMLMGASGSISAVVVFYALRFPNARLRFVRLARWHTMPASAGLLFWFLTKLASTQGLLGRAEPTAWPYVGGALVGLVFWYLLRRP
jgi:membrane associated rhomboid family serine protease/Zn-finger nucleic acid-binding protein